MDYLVQPAPIKSGTVKVPGDKSISHRALMLSAIADGASRINNFLNGADCLSTAAALQSMGVPIEHLTETSLRVEGVGRTGLSAPPQPVHLGNSGTGMRLLTGLLCAQPFQSTLLGDASLSRRPMDRIIEPLTRMGARITSADGRPPLTIEGRAQLAAIDYSLPVASAQVKSALLLAALYAKGTSTIVEPALTRDHTERLLLAMGVDLQSDNGRIRIRGGQSLQPAEVEVPGDLSSATFLMLAALLAPDCELLIENVGVNPTRNGVITILRQMGADLTVENAGLAGQEPVADLRVRSSTLRGIDVDPAFVSLAIDEFPALFVAAAAAQGQTRFSGIGELRVKESDRIAGMAAALRQLGIVVEEAHDGAIVQGGRLGGGEVDSCSDHRIAMSIAVAATIADNEVIIRHIENVDTSFPCFDEIMRSLHANIRMTAGEQD